MTLGFTTRVRRQRPVDLLVYGVHTSDGTIRRLGGGHERLGGHHRHQAHFGADSSLGFRYDVNNGTCSVCGLIVGALMGPFVRLVNGTTLI